VTRRWRAVGLLLGTALLAAGCDDAPGDVEACLRAAWAGIRSIAEDRAHRFLGKVGEDRARCRGGARAVARRPGPWVDWPNYWATGDAGSRAARWGDRTRFLRPDARGLDGEGFQQFLVVGSESVGAARIHVDDTAHFAIYR